MRHPIAGRTVFHGKYPKSSQTKTTYAHFRTVLTSSQNFKKNLHLPSEIFRRFYFPQDLVAPREFSLFHPFPGRFWHPVPTQQPHTHKQKSKTGQVPPTYTALCRYWGVYIVRIYSPGSCLCPAVDPNPRPRAFKLQRNPAVPGSRTCTCALVLVSDPESSTPNPCPT